MQERLMILGAGPNQLPAIRRAVDLGFYVITVDFLPENVGHEFSHQSVNCSTVDKEEVLKVAKDLDIDGVVTFASDVATPTVGFVAEQLSFPGGSFSVAHTLSNKPKFRIFQREHGLNSPNFLIAKQLEDIGKQIATLSPPLVFKPVDTSGSRGVSRVDQIDRDCCAAAFEYAQGYSRSKTVCIEEIVEGVDVSGDGFLLNSELHFAVITQKYKSGFVVTGHSLPTSISIEDQERVFDEVIATCNAVGYTDGPIDFDVRVSPESVTVLEMSPRLGGNCIPLIIERATGIDLITAALKFALGEALEFTYLSNHLRSCGCFMFGSNHGGLLEGIATSEEVRAVVPEVFEYVVNYHIEDEVPEFVHSGNSLGYALFDCPPQLSYSEIVDRLQSVLRLKIV